MFQIRPLKDEDRNRIIKLWHRGWHDAHAQLVPPEVLASRAPVHFELWLDQSEDETFVAVDSGLFGFVSLKLSEITRLYVDRVARGTGVASSLLCFGEGLLLERDRREAELFCVVGNSRAQKFYERMGWMIS